MKNTNIKIPSLQSLEWENYSIEDRDSIIFDLMMKQFRFNKKNVPFYKKYYQYIEESQLDSYSSFIENLPLITKTILKKINSPYEFIGENISLNNDKIYLHRGTGGTTGRPTSIFYSKNDWLSAIFASNRIFYTKFKKEFNARSLIAFNNYNQSHIAGPIFNAMIHDFHGITINRHFNASDEEALKELCFHRCNLIISPAISSTKGGTIETLLSADASTNTNYINGDNIKYLFLSSTNLTKELYDELISLGIKNIFCFYGSTEILPIAISCEHDPFKLHLVEGHIYANVIDSNQKILSNGERGMLIAGKIASATNDQSFVPAQGNTFMNYLIGDEVTLLTEPCSCGRNTRCITNIKRKLYKDDKVSSGCQVW